ncbi:hypothetical protein Leryth_025946 [Lithospermum erythrorhizon]|nr:hypothetical protein Leryth_025946 [Lithospermum erythrorhizon]
MPSRNLRLLGSRQGYSTADKRMLLPAPQEALQHQYPGPGPDSRIVYIDGAFDLFHAGHVEILRLARGLGDFLLVGIHPDHTVRCDERKIHYEEHNGFNGKNM